MFEQAIYYNPLGEGRLIDLFRGTDCQLTIRKSKNENVLIVNPKTTRRYYTFDELKEVIRIMENA
jgi:hypothetical protein